jgi:hypothetical protein
MTREQMDGLYFVILGCLVFLFAGIALQMSSQIPMGDFKGLYYEARCLLHHRDAYSPTEMESFYFKDGGPRPSSDVEIKGLSNITRSVNLPTSLFMVAPFGLLPWDIARLLWTILCAVSFISAALLIWDTGAKLSPVLSGALVGCCLAGSELFLILGNPACIVISCCIVAAWCFLRQRFVIVGTLCMAVGLLLKPHDAGFVWLYFLLSGARNRKFALRTLIPLLTLSILGVLWVWSIAPNWLEELRLNLGAISSLSGVNNPGPSSIGGHGIGMIISLQSVFSIFRDDPAFYDLATYIVCGPLILIWLIKTLKSSPSSRMAWFALAPISMLSMLPLYHRIYDAPLMLLSIPCCAMLWSAGGVIAWAALILTLSAILVCGAIPWALFLEAMKHLPPAVAMSSREALIVMQVVPAPCILLICSVFYLGVYCRYSPSGGTSNGITEQGC